MLSVIIPAYKEEKNIERTIRSIFEYLNKNNQQHEILVVTDGSRDRTNEIVRSLKKEITTLELIEYDVNRGKGFAVKSGMLKAKGDIRLFTDADNSTSIEHLEKMIPYINNGYDVVIASIGIRKSKMSAESEPLWRKIFGKVGNLFIQIMVVPGIRDTQRGFKVFTAAAAEKIFPKLTIERWGFDIEVLALARKFGYKIKEVPIDWKNDPESHVGLRAYFQVLMETVKIRWNLLTKKYDR